ncbi:hypothetical protein [Clostridium botulinum]|uniref:hypothetical protein n=1 Tax=Clostridium botulinum TaxID=1491 RepID=UPI0018FE9550|nr:hypothetical protein [Clostridium botulinum]
MRIEKILKTQQLDTKQNNKKCGRGKKEELSFFDAIELIQYDSYERYREVLIQK